MREGWYIAKLYGYDWEVVRVKRKCFDGDGARAGDLVAESAGYQTAFPVEKFKFNSRVKMPRNTQT